jgi:aspartate/methionine/tyrosine aminotransferase
MDMGYLEFYNTKLAKRAEVVNNKIQGLEGLSLNKPTAGFFSFIDISELEIDSNTFCGRLIDRTGVATTPGLAFGENWDDHFRLSYAVEDDTLMRGLDLIEKFVKEL